MRKGNKDISHVTKEYSKQRRDLYEGPKMRIHLTFSRNCIPVKTVRVKQGEKKKKKGIKEMTVSCEGDRFQIIHRLVDYFEDLACAQSEMMSL